MEDGFNGIPTRTSGAKAIGMRRQPGFPFRFQSLAYERLPCPIALGGNPERAFFEAAWFWNPRASQRHGFAVETQLFGKRHTLWWREGLDPIDACGVFAAIILGHSTRREQPSIPRLHKQFLEFACCSDGSTLRGSVNPLLETEDMPVDLFPGDVLPGHHQGLALCVGA